MRSLGFKSAAGIDVANAQEEIKKAERGPAWNTRSSLAADDKYSAPHRAAESPNHVCRDLLGGRLAARSTTMEKKDTTENSRLHFFSSYTHPRVWDGGVDESPKPPKTRASTANYYNHAYGMGGWGSTTPTPASHQYGVSGGVRTPATTPAWWEVGVGGGRCE